MFVPLCTVEVACTDRGCVTGKHVRSSERALIKLKVETVLLITLSFHYSRDTTEVSRIVCSNTKQTPGLQAVGA